MSRQYGPWTIPVNKVKIKWPSTESKCMNYQKVNEKCLLDLWAMQIKMRYYYTYTRMAKVKNIKCLSIYVATIIFIHYWCE